MTGPQKPKPSEHLRQRTHELGKILDACIAARQDEEFEDLREDCRILTKYRTVLVYPGPIPYAISVEEAKAAIEKARRIKNFVMKKAQALGYYQD
ncbi:MAG: HEPN domain-containing protein [candidate division KSB1 bacterium]|nr:HEPN domain-containing protein [candidate division KSB1 bacterium]MDZ7365878.1 HEPN domain-containing protein [candidate division KSB1 bacterium]MDZ7403887.1 HEPN domain-containing protein [candidate division KSB1 bacterium]